MVGKEGEGIMGRLTSRCGGQYGGWTASRGVPSSDQISSTMDKICPCGLEKRDESNKDCNKCFKSCGDGFCRMTKDSSWFPVNSGYGKYRRF